MLTGNKNCVNIFKLSYDSKLFLENCILKYLINISMFRHPRCGNESYQTKKQTKVEKSTKTEWCNAIHHLKVKL